MIQRRQFLGAATAAAATLTGLSARAVSAATAAGSLGWQSKVIQTVKHGNLKRKPVVTGVSLQPNGNLLAIVGDDHYVSLYDIDGQRFVEHLKKHTDWVRSAKFSPDSKALFTCANDRRLVRWETDKLNQPTYSVQRRDAVIEMAISSDSQKIATVGFNEDLIVHDAETGGRIAVMKCPCDDNHAVAFSADDKMIAAAGRCGTIRVWDTETEEKVHEIKAHRRRIRSLEFTEDGDLISAGDDQIVKINKLKNGAQTMVLPRQATKLFAVKTIAPSVIATSGSDNKIHIWNTLRGSEIGMLDKHTGTVTSLDLAQDVLVSGSFDTTVRIWTPDPVEIAIATPVFISPAFKPTASANQSSAKTDPKPARR